jgi:hypothetical protein
VVQVDVTGSLFDWGKKRRKRDDNDFGNFFGNDQDDSFFGEIDTALKIKDPSVEYYPQPFCNIVESEYNLNI